MFGTVRDRFRERRLGSDLRAGRRVRDQVRREQWDFVRRNASFFAMSVALGGVGTAAVAWLAPNDYLSGASIGAGAVLTIGGLAFSVVMLTGTGSRAMGAVGEAWTSSELRPLRKRGWKLRDHVFYRYRDVDHLLVGPAGLVVVETKWSAEPWTLDPPGATVTKALDQLRKNAHDVRLVVPELRQRECAIRSVLFLWGGTRSSAVRPTEPVRIGDVDVVVGTVAAAAWRETLATAPLFFDTAEQRAVWDRMRAQAAKTDERETAEPPLPTLTHLYWTAGATFVAALADVLAVIYPITWTGSIWAGYAAAGVAVAVGIIARRAATLRHPALGWLTGVTVMTVALVAMQMST